MSVLNLIWFSLTFALVSCKEYVPVLIWSTQTVADSYPVISALSKLSPSEFSDYLLKRVKLDNPTILLFVEENLSVEDFSWRDVNENGAFPKLSNITRLADDVAFLPSVHDPYKAIKKLKSYGYLWKNYEKEGLESLKEDEKAVFEVKLQEPDYLEDRPDMLKEHDEQMSKVYEEALKYRQNIMVLYTGNHISWIDAELGRYKREEKETNDSNIIVISDAKNYVRMTVSSPILFINTMVEKPNATNITQVIGQPTIPIKDSENLTLSVRFQVNNEAVGFDFKFTSDASLSNWWSLNSIEYNKTNFLPTEAVGAPANYSFFCNPSVIFQNSNNMLIFNNFQAQPRLGENNSFGPVHHCIPFFSISIWSGLIIVFILSGVLAWGIVMIMDINTNDRFDDPKGKTITITVSD